MSNQIGPALRWMFLMTILTGLVYPAVVTGVCHVLFPWQADGSLVKRGGHVVGSALIGQNFSQPQYFHPRPSAEGYDATASTGSNLGPTSQKLADRVQTSIAQFRIENPGYSGPIPADMVTASGSGLDPDISPASAQAQVVRIASARGVSTSQVQELIRDHIIHRQWSFLGEPRVNVLELNLALDQQFPQR
jgi:K+-transporting ATPase ATPase C chain